MLRYDGVVMVGPPRIELGLFDFQSNVRTSYTKGPFKLKTFYIINIETSRVPLLNRMDSQQLLLYHFEVFLFCCGVICPL